MAQKKPTVVVKKKKKKMRMAKLCVTKLQQTMLFWMYEILLTFFSLIPLNANLLK